jgi:hypothetical protein
MNVREIEPIIRIVLYIVAGYMIHAGLPKEIADMLIVDPVLFETISQVIGLVIAGVTFVWWRLAKMWGRET